MLDNEVNFEHHLVKWHKFWAGKQTVMVHKDTLGLTIPVKAKDSMLDFLYALASYIHSKQFSTGRSKPWVTWADKPFKAVLHVEPNEWHQKFQSSS